MVESKAKYLMVGLVIINLGALLGMVQMVQSMQGEVADIRESNQEYRADLRAQQNGTVAVNGAMANTFSTTVPIVVFETRGGGSTSEMSISTVPGDGLYFRNDEAPIDPEMQTSMLSSYGYVMSQQLYRPPHEGVHVAIDDKDDWDIVGGRSASLSFGLGMAATRGDIQYNESVAATGSLRSSGKIDSVAKINEKARAARESGYDVFLYPASARGGNVEGITMVPVSNFGEAAEYALIYDESGNS